MWKLLKDLGFQCWGQHTCMNLELGPRQGGRSQHRILQVDGWDTACSPSVGSVKPDYIR